MTNFSGIRRKGLWSWMTPERAVLVGPVLIGLSVSLVLLGVGIVPLGIRVRDQRQVVDELAGKADSVPILRQKLAELKFKQEQRDKQLDRLLSLLAGTSELRTFLAKLNDIGRLHNVSIDTTKPGDLERFIALTPGKGEGTSTSTSGDPMLNRGLEKRSAAITVTGPFQQVLAFLQELEKLEVFVVLREMSVQRQGRTSEKDVDRSEVQMNLTVSVYGRQLKPSLQSEASKN